MDPILVEGSLKRAVRLGRVQIGVNLEDILIFSRFNKKFIFADVLIASFYLVDRGLWHRLPGISGFGPACCSSVGPP
jgi:hypothetical protein